MELGRENARKQKEFKGLTLSSVLLLLLLMVVGIFCFVLFSENILLFYISTLWSH